MTKPLKNGEGKVRRVRLSTAEMAMATRMIMANARVDDSTKMVFYNPDWSDERIRSILAQKEGRSALATESITSFRRSAIGYTPGERDAEAAESPGKGMGRGGFFRHILGRIDALERRVADLEDQATRPRSEHHSDSLPSH